MRHLQYAIGATPPVLVLALALPWHNLWGSQGQAPAAKVGFAGKDERALLQQAVGLLSASQVYQAYLNVGFIADGKAAGYYAEKDAQQILDSVFNLLAASDKHLEKIGNLEITKADREGLTEIRRLSNLVRQQGTELQAFWKTGDKVRGARYEKLRQESWLGISKLLSLDEGPKAKQ